MIQDELSKKGTTSEVFGCTLIVEESETTYAWQLTLIKVKRDGYYDSRMWRLKPKGSKINLYFATWAGMMAMKSRITTNHTDIFWQDMLRLCPGMALEPALSIVKSKMHPRITIE